jgi:hypothetical protein
LNAEQQQYAQFAAQDISQGANPLIQQWLRPQLALLDGG